MHFDDAAIKKILLDGSYVEAKDLQKAEASAKGQHGSLREYLVAEGILSADLLGQAIAESLGVSYADLNSNVPTKEQVLKIPAEVAQKYRTVLFSIDEKKHVATVTTDDPTQKNLAEELAKLFPGYEITLSYSLTEDIDANLVNYQKPLETRFSGIIRANGRVAPELLSEIFDDAAVYRASDIHFEPQKEEILVRFRIDGVLREAGRIPREFYENILNRIKVQCGLRIDEHFTAQDGSLRYEKGDTSVDMRASIVPTIEGEKVVLRVLSAYVQGFSLAELGLSQMHQDELDQAARKPFGMILVAGPTGSGKTTTLYALLKIMNKPEVNITTIEDPVEYKVLGVNQIQVNVQSDLTFAKGMRSIVRQDPNIILVGEIRDEETAEIAVNAALTGHLLLSTFHSNDAATAIPRLLDMHIEPFLLASTLEVIVAQRLVRKLCDNCRYSTTVSVGDIALPEKIAEHYFGKSGITLYQGKGCEKCHGSGYQGRTALFEFIQITPEMQELILKRSSTLEIWHLAKKQGSISLFEDGIEKVKNGISTVEELTRVAEIPELAIK